MSAFPPLPALLLALAALALGAASCGGSDDAVAEGGDPEEVTFALAWLPVTEAAAWYSARAHGWFEDVGLDVEIARGFGSGDTATRVATGEADFGIVDMAALVPMRVNEGLPVVAIAAVYAEPFHGVHFRTGDGIEEPGDLEGRAIACSAGNANMLMFPAFAAAAGIDEDAVEWRLGEPASVTAAFASGQTDAACSPVPEQPFAEAQTDEDLGHFYFVDYGLSVYSQMLVASERTIEQRPDLVERFVSGALRGLAYAIDHPVEAVEILLAHQPDLEADLTHEAWALILEYGLMANEVTERHAVGHIDDDRMRDTFHTLVEALGLDAEGYAAQDFYTVEFLP